MARVKTFVNGGSLLPGDLNSIQDDYDTKDAAHAALKTGIHGIPTMAAGQGILWNGTNWIATTIPASGAIVNADVAAGAGITYAKLALSNGIVNGDINATAAIAYAKLALGASIVNADVATAAAIAYSKLNLTGLVVNADIAAAAAIAYSKLNLTGLIVNADIAAGAAILGSKLEVNARPATLLGAYRTILRAVGFMDSGNSSAGAYTPRGGGIMPALSTQVAQPFEVPYFDTTGLAVAGLTAMVRVRLDVFTNQTAPAATITATLRNGGVPLGNPGVIQAPGNSVISGSSVAIASPLAATSTTAVTSDFALPSGFITPVIVFSGSFTTNAAIVIAVSTELHYV